MTASGISIKYGMNSRQIPRIAHTARMKGAVNPGRKRCLLKRPAIHVEPAEAMTNRIKLSTDSCKNAPTAIPTNVPLNPYKPFLMSSYLYPEK